ncbi:hypothetical protein HYW17_03155 [Candidatus Uhrbacteria bacterium]|nr:hypothetical protein [Candidatus Uhrbacteria bacterium]
MKKIVLFTISGLLVAAGAYHIALLANASQEEATAASAIIATAFAVVVVAFRAAAAIFATTATTIVAIFAATIALALETTATTTATIAAVDTVGAIGTAIYVFVVVAFVFALVLAPSADALLGVPYGWAIAIFGVGAVTLFGILMLGRTVWGVVVVVEGVLTILTLWRLYHVQHRDLTAPVAAAQ